MKAVAAAAAALLLAAAQAPPPDPAPPGATPATEPAPPLPPQRPKRARTCADTIGRKRAADLLGLCREVSSSPRPGCRPSSDCGVLRDEIRRGCREAVGVVPTGCRDALEPEEHEEREQREIDED